jgi:hypothetical protein
VDAQRGGIRHSQVQADQHGEDFKLAIRILDVTERAFSTYNDKARMWMQMDTEMDLALPVEEHRGVSSPR